MPLSKSILALSATLLASLPASAAVPGLLNYQGRVLVGSTAFDGTGAFKFALVNADGTQLYWSNSADGNSDHQPDAAVSLPVAKGLYAVHLGDTALANMAPLSASVFTNSAVYLRVWFDDGTNGFQALAPDQRVVAVGYALMAATAEQAVTVANGAITTAQLEPALAAKIELSATAGLTVVSSQAQDTGLMAKGFAPFSTVPAPAWINGGTAGAADARYGHSAVWTGTEFIVWGGSLAGSAYSGSGGRYAAATDAWTPVSTVDSPVARSGHTAVWTGTEMIIWGGFSADGRLNSGGRFQPEQQLWSATSLTGAPLAREGHTVVWTGARMLVWGGHDGGAVMDSGALYNPAANQWTALSLTGAPAARTGATAIWTGTNLVVWGGQGASDTLNTGGRLALTNGITPGEWQATSTVNAPGKRKAHTAIWTGQKMIVWGGLRNNAPLGDGGVYDPVTDTWTTLPATGAPAARSGHTALWTGTEMIIFGGETTAGAVSTGAAFNPTTSSWRALDNGGSPVARTGATASWTGTELLVFGGRANGSALGALQRLNPQPAWHFYRKL